MSSAEAVAELTRPGGPFEVAEADVGGVRMRVWASAPPSLVALLHGARRHGDRDFLVYRDERHTFAQHHELVSGLARWLATQIGVRHGDRVAIGMRNYPEWVISFWATQVLGAIAVPLNAWWSAPELRFALEDSGPTVALLDGERYERLAGDLAELRLPSVVARHDAPLDGQAVAWAEVVAAAGPGDGMPDCGVGPEDASTIIYTSGTTGRPKGAVATHRNHVTNFMSTALTGAVDAMVVASRGGAGAGAVAADAPHPRPCSLITYPFFHIGGLSTLYLSTGFGVKMVLQYKWDVREALELIQRERVTNLAAVPALLREVLESPLLDKYDVSTLGNVGSGGAPVPPDLVARVDRKLGRGVSPSNGYGLTETTSAVTIIRGHDYKDRPTSVGRPLPVVDIKVVDPASSEERPAGEVGELWCRGPSVVKGYWNQPAATAEAFSDGWFHTGDLGFVDDDCFVHVVDRLKDVIIRGGENIYCAEVEAALFEHPAVADVALVGVPDRYLGEEAVAVVQLEPGATVGAGSLQDHVRARLARFKVPAHVVFHPGPLPRTATGKVLKRQLRDELRASGVTPMRGPG